MIKGEIQFLLDGNQQQSEIDQFERAMSGTGNPNRNDDDDYCISSIDSFGFSTNRLSFTIMCAPWELKTQPWQHKWHALADELKGHDYDDGDDVSADRSMRQSADRM